MKSQTYRCPYCGSTRNHSKGSRKTATLGPRPRRHCNNCEREWTVQAPMPAVPKKKRR